MKPEKTEKFKENSVLAEAIKGNESNANRLCCVVLVFFACICVATAILNAAGVFRLSSDYIVVYILAFINMLIPVICNRSGRFSSSTIKKMVLVSLVVTAIIFDIMASYNSPGVTALPILVSSLYFDKKTIARTAIVTAVICGIESFICAKYPVLLDANHVEFSKRTVLTISGTLKEAILEAGYDNGAYIRNTMLLSFIPKLIMLAMFVTIAYAVLKYGREMIMKQVETTAEQTRISTELDVASRMQIKALPDEGKLNGRYNFELAGSMETARETGGDFYDFAMLDDNHLAVIIGDVSDKGVPAALFMMSTKARINTACRTGLSPAEILEEVNRDLCKDNGEEMFVTVWMGILELDSGVLTAVNAGHQNLFFYEGDGEYNEVPGEHDLFLGMFEDAEFTDVKNILKSDNVLFLYTDGVTDARNPEGEEFGAARLRSCLNSNCRREGISAGEILDAVKSEVAAFAGNTEQFDDITMLVLKYL